MIFPSTLIISSNPDRYTTSILDQLGHSQITNNPDVLLVEDYTIQTIKNLNTFLAKSPLAHDNKVIIIPECSKLMPDAQNALLKNLEEPGNNNYFILTCAHSGKVINTVKSRCHLVIDPTTPLTIQTSQLAFNLPSSKAILLSDQLLSQTNPTQLLTQELSYYHHQLTINPDQTTKRIINSILHAIHQIESNIDPKFVLDYLLLTKI